MMGFEGWFAPAARSGGLATRSALVVIADPKNAVAVTLVLQEMGLTVDLGSEPVYALRWLRRARYDVIVVGGPGVSTLEFAARLRETAAEARIILVTEQDLPPGDLDALGVETLGLPFDVNALVGRFW
ncbi:MAG: hypothetical protein WD058_05310 [Dehalococcoidia bacterium]